MPASLWAAAPLPLPDARPTRLRGLVPLGNPLRSLVLADPPSPDALLGFPTWSPTRPRRTRMIPEGTGEGATPRALSPRRRAGRGGPSARRASAHIPKDGRGDAVVRGEGTLRGVAATAARSTSPSRASSGPSCTPPPKRWPFRRYPEGEGSSPSARPRSALRDRIRMRLSLPPDPEGPRARAIHTVGVLNPCAFVGWPRMRPGLVRWRSRRSATVVGPSSVTMGSMGSGSVSRGRDVVALLPATW